MCSCSTLVLCVEFPSVSELPRGSLVRLPPDETAHALVFKIAERIAAKAPTQELQQWKRVLLNTPATFKWLVSNDERYAEANSFRMDVFVENRAVQHTARQMARNTHSRDCQLGCSSKCGTRFCRFRAAACRLADGGLVSFDQLRTCGHC